MSERLVSDMKFDELIEMASKKTDPNTKEAVRHVRSYQYQISLDILGARIDDELTISQAAKRAGLPKEEYESFENGINKSATKDEYLSVLNSLKLNPLNPLHWKLIVLPDQEDVNESPRNESLYGYADNSEQDQYLIGTFADCY